MRKMLLVMALVLLALPVFAQPISETRATASFWHEQWDIGLGTFVNGKELRLNYHRQTVAAAVVSYVNNMVTTLGWATTDKMAVVGAGFGFFEQELRASHGFTDVVSLDDSAWIQSAKNTTEDADMDAQLASVGVNPLDQEGRDLKDTLTDGGLRARVTILDEGLLSKESRQTVKQTLGGQVDVIFTDNMLPFITDAEAVAFSVAANQFGPVTHSVNPAIDGRDVSYWKALLPGDTIINWFTLEVQ